MTSPGGHGNDINLAALWIPVMPETSHMGEHMRTAGREAKQQFEQGFNSGNSPESIGQGFGAKLQAALSHSFKNFELPFGASGALEKFGNDVDKNVVKKLSGEASTALKNYRGEYDKLTVAQNQATEAQGRLTVAQEGGFNKANIMLPLMQENTRAQKALTEAHTSASTSLGVYQEKTARLGEAQSAAADSGKLMAGIMGGLIVAGAQMAVAGLEKVVEVVTEGFVKSFEMGIDVTKEFTEKMLEIGEKFENISIQIHEFSGATGEDFKHMEEAATEVFSTLDVVGKDTGKTMAQLASMMGVPAESIKGLVHDVMELQGRFSNLKAADLGGIFNAFKVPASQADSVLASMGMSARNAGQGLGDLSTQLSGNVAITLAEAGLNAEQAAAFTANLMKLQAPGRQAMTGMTMAMKEFTKEGISFSDGMKMAGERLQALGDTAAGQDLAETLFGGRNWIVATTAVKDYLDVVNQGPDAFHASVASLQEFLTSTETLGNKWELVKHRVEDAFKPMGQAALGLVGKGFDSLLAYVNSHMEDLKRIVAKGGLFLISVAHDLEQFAIGLLGFFAPIADAIVFLMSNAIKAFAGTAQAAGELLRLMPGFHDMGQGMVDASVAAYDMGDKLGQIKVGDKMHELQSFLQQHPIDVQTAGDAWIKFWEDASGQNAPPMNPMLGASVGGGNPFIPTPAAPGAYTPGGPGATGGVHHADWDAIAAQESTGVWNMVLPTGVTEGGGLQIKPDTWYEFGGLAFAPKPYQATKEQQIAIAERILNGWGSNPGQGPKAWANGSTYVERKLKGGMITGGSGRGDDVAALLGKGEYVWDTDTVDKYGWLIKLLHQGGPLGFDEGGGVLQVIYSNLGTGQKTGEAGGAFVGPGTSQPQYYGKDWEGHTGHVHTSFSTSPDGQFYGLAKGTDIRQGQSGFPPWVYALGAQFGVEASTYAGHQEGSGFNRGIDWWPKGHADMSGQSYTAEERNRLQSFATAVAGFGVASAHGGTPSAFGATTPLAYGPRGGDQYSGMPGGETEDQRRAAEKAVQEARDRKTDLDYQVTQNDKKVRDLNKQISDLQSGVTGDIGIITGKPLPVDPKKAAENDKKLIALQDELANATHTLEVSRREAGEQTANITDAERKQGESAARVPTGAGTGGGRAVPGAAAAESLGGGLLKGIGQELGLGDVFAKSPLDWGITKLAMGLVNWGFGTAEAWSNEIGKGHTGMTGYQPIPGWDQPQGGGGGGMLSGMLGGMGINLPKNVSNSPNVVPAGQIPPVSSGQGSGAPPGPVIQGDYRPIYVSPNVDPNAILGPVQAEQNKYDPTTHTFSGGYPQQ